VYIFEEQWAMNSQVGLVPWTPTAQPEEERKRRTS
jgi:hypothetical protein